MKDKDLLGKSQIKTTANYASYINTIATARVHTFEKMVEEAKTSKEIIDALAGKYFWGHVLGLAEELSNKLQDPQEIWEADNNV